MFIISHKFTIMPKKIKFAIREQERVLANWTCFPTRNKSLLSKSSRKTFPSHFTLSSTPSSSSTNLENGGWKMLQHQIDKLISLCLPFHADVSQWDFHYSYERENKKRDNTHAGYNTERTHRQHEQISNSTFESNESNLFSFLEDR